jgi:hypothetical protein
MITYDECLHVARDIWGPLPIPKRIARASQVYDVSLGMGVPTLSRADREKIEAALNTRRKK